MIINICQVKNCDPFMTCMAPQKNPLKRRMDSHDSHIAGLLWKCTQNFSFNILDMNSPMHKQFVTCTNVQSYPCGWIPAGWSSIAVHPSSLISDKSSRKAVLQLEEVGRGMGCGPV